MPSENRKDRILITGGSGFVGRALVAALRTRGGVDLHLALRSPDTWQDDAPAGSGTSARVHLHRLDLTDEAAVSATIRAIRPDTVFHLATARPSAGDWRTLIDVNIIAPMVLLEACADSGASRIVTTGSSQELLDIPPEAYGTSRQAGAILHRQQAERLGLNLVHLRTGYVYGPGMDPKKFIPTAIHAIREGHALRLTDPSVRRTYVHLDDLIAACLLAAQAPVKGYLGVAALSPRAHSAHDVARTLADLMEMPLHVSAHVEPSRPWDGAEPRIAGAGTIAELGWSARMTLRDGLSHTLRHSFASAP